MPLRILSNISREDSGIKSRQRNTKSSTTVPRNQQTYTQYNLRYTRRHNNSIFGTRKPIRNLSLKLLTLMSQMRHTSKRHKPTKNTSS